MALFAKKQPENDTLELMKFHITQSQAKIKEIHEERESTVRSRMKDSNYNRADIKGNKSFISDLEAHEFDKKIGLEEQKLLGQLDPLIAELRQSLSWKIN